MGLGKLQLHAKLEVADFIYYGNIMEFVYGNWDKPKRGNQFLEKTDFIIGFEDPIFPIQCTSFVELWLQKWVIYTKKLHFAMEIVKFWVAGGGGWIFLHQGT